MPPWEMGKPDGFAPPSPSLSRRGGRRAATARLPPQLRSRSHPRADSAKTPRAMRQAILWLNAFGTAVTLLSALAVLGSWLLDPAYRVYFGDSVLFLVGFQALQAWFLRSYLRDTPSVPVVAVMRALAVWVFIALFVSVGPLWMRITPGRYVYQLFDWGPEARIGLFALVFLGRGAFNTFSAVVLTRERWWPLRERYPVLGRVLTVIPVGIIATFVWAFMQMVRLDATTFSTEAYEVARLV